MLVWSAIIVCFFCFLPQWNTCVQTMYKPPAQVAHRNHQLFSGSLKKQVQFACLLNYLWGWCQFHSLLAQLVCIHIYIHKCITLTYAYRSIFGLCCAIAATCFCHPLPFSGFFQVWEVSWTWHATANSGAVIRWQLEWIGWSDSHDLKQLALMCLSLVSISWLTVQFLVFDVFSCVFYLCKVTYANKYKYIYSFSIFSILHMHTLVYVCVKLNRSYVKSLTFFMLKFMLYIYIYVFITAQFFIFNFTHAYTCVCMCQIENIICQKFNLF